MSTTKETLEKLGAAVRKNFEPPDLGWRGMCMDCERRLPLERLRIVYEGLMCKRCYLGSAISDKALVELWRSWEKEPLTILVRVKQEAKP